MEQRAMPRESRDESCLVSPVASLAKSFCGSAELANDFSHRTTVYNILENFDIRLKSAGIIFGK
jgi:hypothetical protein